MTDLLWVVVVVLGILLVAFLGMGVVALFWMALCRLMGWR